MFPKKIQTITKMMCFLKTKILEHQSISRSNSYFFIKMNKISSTDKYSQLNMKLNKYFSEKNEEKNKKEESNEKQTVKEEKKENKEEKKDEKIEETPKSFRENLKTNYPKISKCIEFSIDAWKMTFPKDKYKDKFEKIKQKSRDQKEEEKKKLSEEELANMQENIPEWKRTSLTIKDEKIIDKTSYKDKLKSKFRNKFNETNFAKQIYKSEQYNEFQNFKKEIHQFREDLKDHVENSPNPFIQTSLGLYSRASNESTVAKAIKEMRNLDPTFDLFELEDDAKGIFEAAYTTYLQGNIGLLEKMCGEMALGYFKVLLRKMEVEKCEPKHKYLWMIENAIFVTALIPEKKLPVFIFSIKTQEIHCNISKIDKRIVDGDDERLMHYEYSFALTPHTSPDLENVGHGWELIEIQPKQVMKLLV